MRLSSVADNDPTNCWAPQAFHTSPSPAVAQCQSGTLAGTEIAIVISSLLLIHSELMPC
ncbi:MAG: hypothetical protein NTX73_18450 [Rhodobacterales bacterium]|nr:hypothetical protein [Rhodobacterales bacterium]